MSKLSLISSLGGSSVVDIHDTEDHVKLQLPTSNGVLASNKNGVYSPAYIHALVATKGGFGTSMVFDSVGNLYIAITNEYHPTGGYSQISYIYKITLDGMLSTWASVATLGATRTSLVIDAQDQLYWAIANQYDGSIYTLTSYIYRIDASGIRTTWASVATIGALSTDLAFDSAGNLYWAIGNSNNNTNYSQTSYVYRITPAGVLSTWASIATTGCQAVSLAFDSLGNLHWAVGNYYNGTTRTLTSYIYRITPAGSMTMLASQATIGCKDTKIVFDAQDQLYWAVNNYYDGSIYNLTSYVYRVTSAGAISTIASQPTYGAFGTDLAWDSSGVLYWAVTNYINDSSIYTLKGTLTRIVLGDSPMTHKLTYIDTIGAGETSLLFDADDQLYWSATNFYNGTTYGLDSFVYTLTKQDLK